MQDFILIQNKKAILHKNAFVIKLSRQYFRFLVVPSSQKMDICEQFASPHIFGPFSNLVLEGVSEQSADSQRGINTTCQNKCSSVSEDKDSLGMKLNSLYFPMTNTEEKKKVVCLLHFIAAATH